MARNTLGKAPRIRFKEYTDPWADERIGDVLVEKRRPIVLDDQQLYELITVKRRNEGIVSRGHLLGREILVKNYAQLKAGDFVLSKRQVAHGASGIVPSELDGAIVSNEYLTAISSDRLLAEFFAIVASLPAMRRSLFLSSYGVDIEKLFFDVDDWKKRTVTLPAIPEQKRIEGHFRQLDQLLALHKRKYDKLISLRSAMLQRLFPQPGARAPAVRFTGFPGDWEIHPLGRLVNRVTEKNVSKKYSETFTNSAELGVVSQREYFDKEISNSENISGYYVMEPDSFVYNPRISALAPVGPVNRNRLKRTGIVSPLYTVFRAKGVDQTFLEYFFKTNLWHPFMFLNGDAGARGDRFAIKDTLFMELPIPYPALEEQRKIGSYLNLLDILIAKRKIQLNKIRQLKRACLDGMFA